MTYLLSYKKKVYPLFNSDLMTHNLVTQGFHIIDDFLELEPFYELRDLAISLQQNNSFRDAKIGSKNQAQQNTNIRSDKIHWLDNQSQHPSIRLYLDTTKQMAQDFNQTLFLSLCDFEFHFAVYQPGTFYKKHVDQFAHTKNRKISCVYYLNESWQKNFGGELVLYNHKNKVLHTVHPEKNRFICFNSELPHEVCVTHQTRLSITGWMKTRALTC
jgi:SM-20-related protein